MTPSPLDSLYQIIEESFKIPKPEEIMHVHIHIPSPPSQFFSQSSRAPSTDHGWASQQNHTHDTQRSITMTTSSNASFGLGGASYVRDDGSYKALIEMTPAERQAFDTARRAQELRERQNVYVNGVWNFERAAAHARKWGLVR